MEYAYSCMNVCVCPLQFNTLFLGLHPVFPLDRWCVARWILIVQPQSTDGEHGSEDSVNIGRPHDVEKLRVEWQTIDAFLRK